MGETPYVLISSVRNEADYLEHTLQSVVAQSVLPLQWVIVNDASTDGTETVVARYVAEHAWIHLLNVPESEGRNFASKARNVALGYDRLRELDFEVIGNLDGDVSFEPGHMEFLLDKFSRNPSLGVAGTAYLETRFDSRTNTLADADHVSGQCQLFRRACWEEIGGYVENKGGGIDWIAVRMARLKGWETRSFHERTFFHHKPMGTGGGSMLRARFQYGKKDYALGGHPVWETLRCVFQMRNRPLVLGGLLMFAGYTWAWVRRVERSAPPELVALHRREQMSRLREMIRGVFGAKPTN